MIRIWGQVLLFDFRTGEVKKQDLTPSSSRLQHLYGFVHQHKQHRVPLVLYSGFFQISTLQYVPDNHVCRILIEAGKIYDSYGVIDDDVRLIENT